MCVGEAGEQQIWEAEMDWVESVREGGTEPECKRVRYKCIKGEKNIQQEEVGDWAKCFRKGKCEKDQKRPQDVAANSDIIWYV